MECLNSFIKKLFEKRVSINTKKEIKKLIVLKSPFIDKKSYEQYKSYNVVSFYKIDNIIINNKILNFLNVLFYNVPCNIFITIRIFKYM
uniref:Ribosomal protein S10 n=1 Tax=Cyanoptyche gloeocystis TaxID=77922 RepID=A0A096Y6Y7_9EUKA|nr:ribosomal protein S10 [Cyanoptyche gloeocystis]AIM52090.1 ribosomal protein S10 [Cyanoptyche gloeocystis]